MQNLREKISSGQAVVGVIGLGYVGLPLSLLNARKFKVVGYDIDTDLVHNLRQGHSEANGVSPANLVSIVGRAFYVAYSPERIDPGRKDVELEMIPRVVGGHDKNSTIIACGFLQASFERVVAVKDCRTAEATKMLENIFRAVNIALVNELALALERMNISVWEVIEAASTKPFGFMAFW